MFLLQFLFISVVYERSKFDLFIYHNKVQANT